MSNKHPFIHPGVLAFQLEFLEQVQKHSKVNGLPLLILPQHQLHQIKIYSVSTPPLLQLAPAKSLKLKQLKKIQRLLPPIAN